MRSSLLMLLAGWSGGDDGAAQGSTDEPRAGDEGRDRCETYGWYGDGVCDDFCWEPDVQDCTTCGAFGGVSTGACDDAEGDECGGRLDLGCPDGWFCDYSLQAHCGATDRPGTCARVPETCIEIRAQVCGCDGEIYSSACEAHLFGVAVSADGRCRRFRQGAPAAPSADPPDTPERFRHP